ncbi:MAG: Hpt domain-containing protein, partial [Azonexus sp.]|nr:Hpt domain-containing protein [Azonexus sp.]
MNAATEFDLGPLTWVKGEIDQALGRATEALDRFAQAGEATQLRFCRTHVHQVHGALDIVGLDGLPLLTESLEAVLLALEEGRLNFAPEVQEALTEALQTLTQYLDDLMTGEPHQPLRILPACSRLAVLRGLPPLQAADLFFPDLSQRPPRSSLQPPSLSAEELKNVLKKQRSRFQRGLLLWLKQRESAVEGRQLMFDAVAAIEAVQQSSGARSFWWVAQAFLESLDQPGFADE